MSTKDCRTTQHEINAAELNQSLSDQATTHLAGCLNCRETRARDASLRGLVASLAAVSAPSDFDMRLRARLAREKHAGTSWINFWRVAQGVPAFAVALVLVVLVTLAVYFRPATNQQVADKSAPASATSVTAPNADNSGAPAPGSTVASGGTAQTQNDKPEVPGIEGPVMATPVQRPRRNEFTAATKNTGISSRDYSTLPAVSVTNSNDSGTASSPVVSLSAPLQPVVVSMRDDRGATRTISLPPVSFGSQRLIQPAYQPVSLASSAKGAW